MNMTRGIVLERLSQNQIFSKIGPPPQKNLMGFSKTMSMSFWSGGGEILFDFLTKTLGIFECKFNFFLFLGKRLPSFNRTLFLKLSSN